ncbi:hypothetical protein CFOL_v3_05346 [Cephalotus follicularis]|uniref:Uncharacterized protein n=1 Tax=Cephalotus follicularis TaxID=3775 RepID=A0A1Q3B1I8_CEPFO|nr:hypothetical protein CFOL_v3_05346 [Cephalotus follicularis]
MVYFSLKKLELHQLLCISQMHLLIQPQRPLTLILAKIAVMVAAPLLDVVVAGETLNSQLLIVPISHLTHCVKYAISQGTMLSTVLNVFVLQILLEQMRPLLITIHLPLKSGAQTPALPTTLHQISLLSTYSLNILVVIWFVWVTVKDQSSGSILTN